MSALELPRAYLITFTAYGTWLHGDPRGSVDRENNLFEAPTLDPSTERVKYEREYRMKDEVIRLGAPRRDVVERAISEVCAHRGWRLYVANVRTNHVHVLVGTSDAPERVMTTLKAWATRRMVEAGLIARGARVWTRHGSTRCVWTEPDLQMAFDYVKFGQGVDLPISGQAEPPASASVRRSRRATNDLEGDPAPSRARPGRGVEQPTSSDAGRSLTVAAQRGGSL